MEYFMGENFIYFKQKAFKIVLAKSIISFCSMGALVSGVLLLLLKLKVIGLDVLPAVLIGLGAAILSGGLVFLLMMPRDAAFAKRLDETLGLDERVRTAVAYASEAGEMYERQRADAEHALSMHSTHELKPGHLWVYIACAVVSLATLVASIVVPDLRYVEPPAETTPFEISPMQVAAMEDLITYVDDSLMEDPYKSDVAEALTVLLDELKAATTAEEMHSSLATALTAIAEATYDSSSETELTEALWNSGNALLKTFAEVLDTSDWDDRETEWWGLYAESYQTFTASAGALSSRAEDGTMYSDEDKVLKLKWLLEETGLKLPPALDASRVDPTDALYAAIYDLFLGEGSIASISAVANLVDGLGYDAAVNAVKAKTDSVTASLFEVLSQTKINSNVGEYVLKKLASLFGSVIPNFERPRLNDSTTESDDRENGGASGGGVGEGVEFGSNDLVLDPLTGEYVTYGTLYAKYNTLMLDKLSNGKYNYTDAQRRAIEKYFALLYSGLKDED